MTQFARELRSTQYIIVLIIFIKKVIILKFWQKQVMFLPIIKIAFRSMKSINSI